MVEIKYGDVTDGCRGASLGWMVKKIFLREKNLRDALKDKKNQPCKNQRVCVAGRGNPTAKVPRERGKSLEHLRTKGSPMWLKREGG